MEKGYYVVDFDARTGHNHGTKFRLKQNALAAPFFNSAKSNLKHIP